MLQVVLMHEDIEALPGEPDLQATLCLDTKIVNDDDYYCYYCYYCYYLSAGILISSLYDVVIIHVHA